MLQVQVAISLLWRAMIGAQGVWRSVPILIDIVNYVILFHSYDVFNDARRTRVIHSRVLHDCDVVHPQSRDFSHVPSNSADLLLFTEQP